MFLDLSKHASYGLERFLSSERELEENKGVSVNVPRMVGLVGDYFENIQVLNVEAFCIRTYKEVTAVRLETLSRHLGETLRGMVRARADSLVLYGCSILNLLTWCTNTICMQWFDCHDNIGYMADSADDDESVWKLRVVCLHV